MKGQVYSASHGLPGQTAPTGHGYVYVVAKAGIGPIKVGVAANVRRRVFSLENQNGQRFPLIWISDACPHFSSVETAVHSCLRPTRLLGEWFDVPFDFAITLTKDLASGRKRSRSAFSTRAA